VDSVIFLVLRRMRAPLLTLIVLYSIAIVGLVLIPGAIRMAVPGI
jgi:voltage-gated potassium channel